MKFRDHVVAFAVPLSIALALSLPVFDRLQGLSIDLLFLARNTLTPSLVALPSPSVAVIAIDEATYNSDVEPFKGTPRVFWTQALAKVLDAVVEGGAAVVGFDLILPTSVERFAKEKDFDKPFRSALYRAARDNKVVLGATTLGERPVLPYEGYRRLVRGQNIRSLNVVLDSDGIIRFVPLHFRRTDDQSLVPSMSLEMATRVLKVDPRIDSEDGALWLDGFRVPARADPQLTIPSEGKSLALKNDLLVDLHFGPAAFQTHSLLDLFLCLDEDGNRDYFKRSFARKAVMLGLTTSVEDRKLTSVRFSQGASRPNSAEPCATRKPTDGGRKPRELIPGVYLHAAAISNLVQGKVLRPLERHEQALLTMIVAVTFGGLVMRLSSSLAGAAFAVVSLGWVGVALGAFVSGIVTPLIHPIAAAGLTLASLLGYRFAVIDRAERHVRRAFGRVLAPTLVERMVQTNQMPTQGGELREITVWISDLQNYTTISEILPPPALVEFLNEVYTVMSDTVEEYEGFVAQFVGDAVVAGFNVPLDDPDHARHGIEAAMVCHQRVDELNEKMDLPEGFNLRIRVGISTGNLLAGYIGSKRRLSYTIVGDDINLASRLEGVNKVYGSTILVNEVTKEHCGQGIVFREVDIVRVKGRDTPVRIFEPLGLVDEVKDWQKRIAERFAEGLALFRSRQFAEATAIFDSLAEQDPVSRSFAERTRNLIAEPPPANWEGVHDLLTK